MSDSFSHRKIISGTISFSILMLIALVLLSLVSLGQSGSSTPPDIWHLIRMGSIQAGISTLCALTIGCILAIALNRLEFRGKSIVIGLLAAAIVAPALAIATGMLAVWGRAGLFAAFADLLGFEWNISPFGLHAIIFAHTILNAPLVARIVHQRLGGIETNQLKLGQSLALSPLQRLRHLDWPIMAPALPSLATLIFLLCFTSFPIVLILGGGPANQTLEVAIFSAVRQSFDLNGATMMAMAQILFCAIIMGPLLWLTPSVASASSLSKQIWPAKGAEKRILVAILIAGLAAYLSPLFVPFITATSTNAFSDMVASSNFWRALFTSVWIGAASSILTIFVVIGLALGSIEFNRKWFRTAALLPAYIYLLVPAIVLSLGLFILVRNSGVYPGDAAPFALIVGNSLLALPFALTVMTPSISAINEKYGKLSKSLGLGSVEKFKSVEWPLMRADIGIVAALAFCFSLGDLGIVALFGTQDFSTLPWEINRALGAYRTNQAEALTATLVALTFAAFIAIPKLFEGRT